MHSRINLLDPNSNEIKMQLFEDEPAQEIIARPASNEVKIMTYNLFLRPPPIKNNLNDHKNSRTDEFLNQIAKYDILCLQEVFGFWSQRKQKLIRDSQRLGFHFYAESPNPPVFSTSLIDGGLLILSKYPIVETSFCAYPYGIFSDSVALKGVLYAKIAIGRTFLHVFTTHMQASYGDKYDPLTCVTRGDQFIVFRQFLEEVIPKEYGGPHEMILILGDFNVNSTNSLLSYKEIETDYTPFELYPFLKQDTQFNEYESLVTCLTKNKCDGIKNLVYEEHNKVIPTYGISDLNEQGEKVPRETKFTSQTDLITNQCLDYIFQFFPTLKTENELKNVDSKERLRVKKGSSKTERFQVDHPKFVQLSDHEAVTTTLVIETEKLV